MLFPRRPDSLPGSPRPGLSARFIEACRSKLGALFGTRTEPERGPATLDLMSATAPDKEGHVLIMRRDGTEERRSFTEEGTQAYMDAVARGEPGRLLVPRKRIGSFEKLVPGEGWVPIEEAQEEGQA